MKEIAILGRPVQLQERSKAQMKGVTIGETLTYKFYDGDFHGMPLLFAEPKGRVSTPRSLSVTANNLTSLFQLPTVFLLPTCPAYERQRLIDKDVYFVVSDKYAHLPIWMWSGHACASIISTPFCWHNLRSITPMSSFIFP